MATNKPSSKPSVKVGSKKPTKASASTKTVGKTTVSAPERDLANGMALFNSAMQQALLI